MEKRLLSVSLGGTPLPFRMLGTKFLFSKLAIAPGEKEASLSTNVLVKLSPCFLNCCRTELNLKDADILHFVVFH